ncbi:MAG: lysophospholipid acyltransferase family protein, partial [Pseudomonadota bacterium]
MRLIAKITAIIFVFLLMFLPLLFARIFKFEKITAWVMQSAFIAGNKILSLKVNIKGEIAKSRPLLIISNHFSYLDVFALGSVGDIKFTPKSDVGSWPVIGLFAKMAGCIFIDRRRSGTLRNKNAVSDAILQGKAISIFPEGTTGDGTALLPFKSSLFSIIDENKLLIQPVT